MKTRRGEAKGKSAAKEKSAPAALSGGEWLAIGELHPWDRNPRNNTLAVPRVARSIRRFGFVAPIVIWRGGNRMVAGDTRLKAMRQILSEDPTFVPKGAPGVGLVRVVFHEFDSEDDANAYAIADNRLNELAEWDDSILAEQLARISTDDRVIIGMDDYVIEPPAGPEEEEEVPAPPLVAQSQVGDLYLLGEHRLLCGDSAAEADVARVMNGRLADIVWTDPPYGVSLNKVQSVSEAKARRRRLDGQVIENDELKPEELREFLMASLGLAHKVSRPGAVWYVAAPSGDIFGEFAFVLGREGLKVWRHTIVWVKDRLVLGRADYHYRHESILYGWKEGAGHHMIEDRKQDTVWEIPRPSASPDHPSMKPVELVERALRNSTNPGELVFEPFGGSGTTLIAAERSGRVCAILEKAPQYCDVIVKRWEQLTGKKAKRVRARAA